MESLCNVGCNKQQDEVSSPRWFTGLDVCGEERENDANIMWEVKGKRSRGEVSE